jgi:tryptophan-rich sensory protein
VATLKGRVALAAGGFLATVAAAAGAGARFSVREPETARWYEALDKPGFTPPDRVFPVVWTTLYGLMAASAWRVWRSASPLRGRALGLWGAQLALNAAWSPIFFGAKRPAAALGDLGALLFALGAYTATARRVDRAAAWLMAPYALWSGFAAVLNAEIVRRNAGPARAR